MPIRVLVVTFRVAAAGSPAIRPGVPPVTDLLCPDCRSPLDARTGRCAQGHQFEEHDGVLVLLEPRFAGRLEAFSRTLSARREAEGKRLTDPAVYAHLPFALARENVEWQMRCDDLALIRGLIGRESQRRILDVGAYNGWLSHQLARAGHQVTAVDQFADPWDGLGARKWYDSTWRAIQMDLADLSVLTGPFDVVIVNHGLHLMPDPVAALAGAMALVQPRGLLIAIGLAFFRDPRARIRAVAALKQRHQERYGEDFFLRPARGYLDWTDRARMGALGVRLRPHPRRWRSNLKSLLVPTAPRHCYGVWRSPDRQDQRPA